MSEKDEIKELFQRKLGNHKVQVDPSLWSGVQAGINAGATSVAGTSIGLFGKIAIGITAASAMTVGAVLFYNASSDKNQPPKEHTIVKEKDIKETAPVVNQKDKEQPHFVVQQNKQNNTGLLSQNIPTEENQQKTTEQETTIPQRYINIENDKTNKNNRIPVEESHSASKQKPTEREKHTVSQTTSNIEPTDKRQPTKEITPIKVDLSAVKIEMNKIDNQYINFTAFGVPADADIFWKFGDGRMGYTKKQEHFYEEKGNYTVQLIVKSGSEVKIVEKEITIKIKGEITQLPNTFTPNGDGYNDLFFITTKEITSFQITIMDERQQVVYSSNNPDFKWDGIDQFGRPVEAGKYFYIIVAEDELGNVINKYQQLIIQR